MISSRTLTGSRSTCLTGFGRWPTRPGSSHAVRHDHCAAGAPTSIFARLFTLIVVFGARDCRRKPVRDSADAHAHRRASRAAFSGCRISRCRGWGQPAGSMGGSAKVRRSIFPGRSGARTTGGRSALSSRGHFLFGTSSRYPTAGWLCLGSTDVCHHSVMIWRWGKGSIAADLLVWCARRNARRSASTQNAARPGQSLELAGQLILAVALLPSYSGSRGIAAPCPAGFPRVC